eukprot:CAMPEP_0204844852 /NCGR_PEP_ID=MMETSP1347-20130617/646_1 /ASSEMBLY_ACC=CAM_ASM_000690 /TAXON_ID=215587 /ORGANISM="Aplanochytrium stocchinoi, Strain GSBS06" /LENGTH=124 /DNA_ID=CAMNT_0051984561 /DNA_START=193 /DNA_END=564 /DNA_ORIENTATION=+
MGSEKGTENETSEPNMRSKQSSPYDPEAKGNLSAKANEFVSLLEADKQKIEELEYRIKALQAKSSEGLRNDVNSQVSLVKRLEENVTSGYSRVEDEKAKLDSEFESLRDRRLEQKKDSTSLIPW